MVPQTAYSLDLNPVSYPGQIADLDHVTRIMSGIAVAAAVPFGVFVCHDLTNTAGADQLASRVPASSNDVTVVGSLQGITLSEQSLAQNPAFSVPTWPQNYVMPVMKKGRVWVLSETAVTDGGAVFARFSANGPLTQLGSVRADADTAHAAQVPGAIFVGTYASAGYVMVELDLV